MDISWVVFAVGGLYCVAALLELTYFPDPAARVMPVDGYIYWLGDLSSEHYRYSPAFYWATAPLRALPFEGFMVIWTALHLAAIAWLGPWTILLAFDDVIRGNVNTFLAVAVVLALNGKPWAWAAPLLTKVTPGVGVLYHAGRREWRAVAVALAVTLGLVAVTWPFGGAGWFDSLRAGTENYRTFIVPLPVRLAIGAGLCLLGRAWLVPVGMLIAMPGLWPASFAILAALPRLSRPCRSRTQAVRLPRHPS